MAFMCGSVKSERNAFISRVGHRGRSSDQGHQDTKTASHEKCDSECDLLTVSTSNMKANRSLNDKYSVEQN